MATDHRKKGGWIAAGAAAAILAFLGTGFLPLQQRIMAGIFVLTILYWLTEPLPHYITGILAAFLSALLLGPGAELTGAPPLDYRLFFYPYASPVVVLMFGGFIMARVFSRFHLDLEFSRWVLGRLGTRPSVVILGIMLLTATMSMWMSNTATTAIMVAMAIPLVRSLGREANTTRALLLAIPFAANIGGIATPIGTPPNAIAIGLLADRGLRLSFLSWMTAGVPLMLILLLCCYLLLLLCFPIRRESFRLPDPGSTEVSHRTLVYATFFGTVLLWITDAIHHVPSALIALVPVLVFATTGLISQREIRELSWDILLLIGGGLSLGAGIQQTGLADSIAAGLGSHSWPAWLVLVLFAGSATVLATFMSNTAAANILIPISLAATALPGRMGITVALCSSLGMALPISTPPNAIAYGSELISSRDMLRVGLIMSLVGFLLAMGHGWLLFKLIPDLYAMP